MAVGTLPGDSSNEPDTVRRTGLRDRPGQPERRGLGLRRYALIRTARCAAPARRLMSTIRPTPALRAVEGRTARLSRIRPHGGSVSTTAHHSSGSVSRHRTLPPPRCGRPLLHQQVDRAQVAADASTAVCTSVRDVTSTDSATPSATGSTISRRVAIQPRRVRPSSPTATPARASPRASARPIPADAPVTSATCSGTRSWPRRTAPVRRAASATAASRAAVASSTVSVRSGAGSAGAKASDFLPSPHLGAARRRRTAAATPAARPRRRAARPRPRRPARCGRPPARRPGSRPGKRHRGPSTGARLRRPSSGPGRAPSRRCAPAARARRTTRGCSSPACPTTPAVDGQSSAQRPGCHGACSSGRTSASTPTARATRPGRLDGVRPRRPAPPRPTSRPARGLRRAPLPRARGWAGQRGVERRRARRRSGGAVDRRRGAARSCVRPRPEDRADLEQRDVGAPRGRRCGAASPAGPAAGWCAAAAPRRTAGWPAARATPRVVGGQAQRVESSVADERVGRHLDVARRRPAPGPIAPPQPLPRRSSPRPAGAGGSRDGIVS